MGILKKAAQKFRDTIDTTIADEKKAAGIRKKLEKKKEVSEASGLIKKYKAQGLSDDEAEFMATRDQKKAKTVGKIKETAKNVGGRANKLGTAFDEDFGSGPGKVTGTGKKSKGKKPKSGSGTGSSDSGARLKRAQEDMISDVGFGNLSTLSPSGKKKGSKAKPGQVPDPFNDFNF